MRIARGLNEISLCRLAAAVRPGSGASIELVFAEGRRLRIACGADKAYLRALVAAVGPGSGARIEVVFSPCADHPALQAAPRRTGEGPSRRTIQEEIRTQ